MRISSNILEKVPDFKVGVLRYHDIVVGDTPESLQQQAATLQQELVQALEEKSYAAFDGLQEWRQVFKALGSDPSRYRPSAEALYRRIKKEGELGAIHSAADTNNLFSLKHEIPIGIYDAIYIEGEIEVRVGSDSDEYEGINGRMMHMAGKLLSADDRGAFGSPIVDSSRTMVTTDTTQAVQIVYLQPSMQNSEAHDLLQDIGNTFIQYNGGTFEQEVFDGS